MDRKRAHSEDDPSHSKRERTEASQESVTDLPWAKWTYETADGRADFDEPWIKCFLSPEERRNDRILRDILQGVLISGKVHPLVFESPTDETNVCTYLRSLPFLDQLLDGETGKARYHSLSPDAKQIVGVAVRDLFLAAWQGHGNDDHQRILDGLVALVDESVARTCIGGMEVACHPTANRKLLKFIPDVDRDLVDPEMKGFFAQVLDTPRLFAVFVDPGELSFHNFENIVPLDRWIEKQGHSGRGLNLALVNPQRIPAECALVTCTLQGAVCDLLLQLASLDLYVPPLNKATRGGERFIFHSALLSKALTQAIRSSTILSDLSKATTESNSSSDTFEFVNYIFRCNRFTPTDAPFTPHRDTPYYDESRSHISKYTLLLYLTPGHGNPFLRIADAELQGIDAMTCVIFDQSVLHEGHPFLDGEKVFLRTELVFRDERLQHDPRIASLFSEACYMTGHGVFDDEIAQYAHACFERANALHWAVEQEGEGEREQVYLRKGFQGMEFLTNGYDYWFRRGRVINAVDCGVVAVLDYLNCKIGGRAFRSLCQGRAVRRRFASDAEVWTFLQEVDDENEKEEGREGIQRLTLTEVDSLIQKHPQSPFIERTWADDDSDNESEMEEAGYTPCCAFHSFRKFNAWKNADVRSEYRKCWKYTRKKLFAAPLVILGQDLRINESNIRVEGDKILFLRDGNTTPLPAFNFAACWNGIEPAALIKPDGEVGAPELLLPPILLHEYEQGFHLVLDLFRNDWMVKVDLEKRVLLPVISNELEEPGEEEVVTFWERAGVSVDDSYELSDASDEWEFDTESERSQSDSSDGEREPSDGSSSSSTLS